MSKTKLIVVVVFVAAFAAGAATGLVFRPFPHHPPGPGGGPGPERGPSWLVTELSLSQAQQDEMLKIWGSVGRSGWQEESEKRQALQKQRDEAIRKLVPASALAELDKVNDAFAKGYADLGEQRRQRFDAAVAKTKAILTPEQRAKYEAILARRPEGRGDRTRFGPGPGWDRSGGGSSTRPAHRPASGPATMPGDSATPGNPATAPAETASLIEPATAPSDDRSR
ncbi:MAG: periplasmic heavy metal sensor [Planctomycetota bacterium]|nr:periplasmic heavy metal sensor [Planctomycetota bacterium]